ncbi:MAG: amidohydrolase [Bryobacterales bacterium]|nr:amidohydrolase [Bryobacterales bacterium]
MRLLLTFVLAALAAWGQPAITSEKEAALRTEALRLIEGMQKQAQVMVDTVFSFGELGFQEFETSRYLSGLLEKEGFRVERGIAGIPTAWVATWGRGKPVISLGSDIDDLPQTSQKPGVAWHEPLVEGAPGHGEGHNSGVPLNILAALAVKRIMERERIPGTIQLWPGVAEELVAGKAHLVRAGLFKDVDVCLFTHVSNNLGVSWGTSANSSGLVSVEYTFKGESAHAGSSPWRGRSALDAVELMNVGWNYRREHLRLAQRSHYVITAGGDQPNVVPPTATVWYYLREADYDHIMELWRIADDMAKGAALMTGTSFTSRLLGSAWLAHFNRPIAEAMYEHIKTVGLPQWSEADQTLAKGIQRELKIAERGLAVKISEMRRPPVPAEGADSEGEAPMPTGGGSDDIGDVSWNVPTVTLRYPSNIPGLPAHHWASAVAMATPIAHKGVIAGAKVQALTMLELLLHPELVAKAWDYFNNVQTKDVKYKSFLRPEDAPATWLNQRIMAEYRPKMKPLYYDSAKHETYLDQLGVKYPTVR